MSHPTINKAIVAAKKAMPSLKKSETNAHGNYNFVSIDAYYETVAKIANDHGLTWRVREANSEIIELAGRQGVTNAVRTRYHVDVMHESGETVEGFFTATITHPLQGAQTAGSSMSYLDKLFMRTTFSVVTGETDADTTDNTIFDTDNAPKRKAAVAAPIDDLLAPAPVIPDDKPEADTPSDFLKMSRDFIALAKTEEQLTRYWNQNESAFNSLKGEAPKEYKELIAAFKARKQSITQTQKDASDA